MKPSLTDLSALLPPPLIQVQAQREVETAWSKSLHTIQPHPPSLSQPVNSIEVTP